MTFPFRTLVNIKIFTQPRRYIIYTKHRKSVEVEEGKENRILMKIIFITYIPGGF